MRSPSGSASGSTRGLAPVAISTTSAVSSLVAPSGAVTLTRCAAMPGTSSTSSPRPATSVTPSLRSWAAMSADCAPRQRLDAVVDLRQRDLGVLDVDVEAEIGRPAQLGAHAGRGDERLGRHAVAQHARAADAVGVDDGDLGDLGSAGGGDERRLVAGGPAADDHDAGRHRLNLAKRAVDRPASDATP